MSWVLFFAFSALLFPLIASVVVIVGIWHYKRVLRRKRPATQTVAFFHPYCNDGGGGERVLWHSIQSIQEMNPQISCVVYTGDSVSPSVILSKVKNSFDIQFKQPVEFVYLTKRHWVEASRYPVLTMLGQSLGSIVLAAEAICKLNPHVYVDSMGFAFTFPLFKVLGGCKVNSTWTRNHIQAIWKAGSKVDTVYPPCDTHTLSQIPLTPRKPYIISVGQFRPEKDHELQLRAFACFLNKYGTTAGGRNAQLVLIGSVRNEDDQKRVNTLRSLAQHLQIEEKTRFELSIPFTEVKQWMSQATVGLHTMWNEHFGIGIVELMAAGVVVVAHDSGGPKADILVPHNHLPTGYLATTAEEYADCINEVLSKPKEKLTAIQVNARHAMAAFSDSVFHHSFKKCMTHLVPSVEPSVSPTTRKSPKH